MEPHRHESQQNASHGSPLKITCDGDKFEKFELLKERFKTHADKSVATTNDDVNRETIETITDKNIRNFGENPLSQEIHEQISASIAFMTVETDLKEIRNFLRSTRKRMQDKEAKAKIVNDWKQVALVLDRTFFFIYVAAIIVSLASMFPR